MKKHLLALVATAAVGLAAHAAPYTMPVYANAADVNADCDRMMADLTAGQQKIEAMPDTSGVALLKELDAMYRRYEDSDGPMSLLTAVHPDKAIRDATEACDLRYQAFNAKFQQSAKVYALLKQVQPADDIDRRFLTDTLNAFEDAGAGLSPEKQKRAEEINNEINRLSQEFERRVREDKTQEAFTEAELKGVPADAWKTAKRDEQGRYLLGMAYPVSGPVIERAVNPRTRERMWRAFSSRAGAENIKTLSQLVALRREYASLFGFQSYPDFATRRRMAQNEATVQKFLGTVKDAVQARERADIEVLRSFKAKDTKQKLADTKIERWDSSYYTEKARKAKFAVDEEQFRPYFPSDASVKFVFRLATRLFGVDFVPVKETLWHPDAQAFEVVDLATRQPIATFYVDLYPREDKFSHAAMWGFRNPSTLVNRLPAGGLVANLNRQGLTIGELETLLHEFGHGLHQVLSHTRYGSQGGTNVLLDFVEAPSQMLEDWVYDAKTLALFQEVCKTCKPVPAALLQRADKAHHFAKGIRVSRQHLYASYDLALYGRDARDPLALWAAMEGDTPLGHVDGTMLPASFGHLASGYAAGYYSYMWSLVVAEDLRTAFEGKRLSPEVGKRYRDTVLANGGQVAPQDLVKQFLGRPTDSRAFFKSLNK
ncbi:M3 family metallopeptidase [Piscinibacter terrae]|uniref:Peptidase n=1 Tax=Piscinibacter terrae TaxID=2496871 RepID=A0A3N7IY85_9BURK|nr:M3 family metallopeptidase [Albitalea terrae]RQP23712.1 peptidase [Albitalea terrae]